MYGLSAQKTHINSHTLDCAVISLVFILCYFLFLGDRPLFVPDEGRYAEIAREMVKSNNYLTPTLNQIKYFEKPILFYWLESMAIHLGGLNLFSLRSVNAALGLLGCLLTYGFTREVFDRKTALFAAGILGTSLLYFVMSHMITLDLPVTVFTTAALYAIFISLQKNHSAKFIYLAAIFAALAILTKGLIGIIFPGLVTLAYLLLTGNLRALKRMPVIGATLLFLVIAAPWHILVNLKNPEFFHFYFIEQHILRYTQKEIGHYEPIWFFIPYILLGLFPWTLFLLQSLASVPRWFKDKKHFAAELFLFLWAALIFIFFSFSKSKLIPYILPVFPPLTILIARYLAIETAKIKNVKITLPLCGLFFLSLFCIWALTQNILPLATSLFIAALTSASFISFAISFWRTNTAIICLIIGSAIYSMLFMVMFGELDNRSVRHLTNQLRPYLTPQSEIIAYNKYYQDLPFYTEKRITILNWRNELSFGMQHQDTSAWMIGDKLFWQKWRHQKPVYVFLDKNDYEKLKQEYPHENFYTLGYTAHDALISNTPQNQAHGLRVSNP